MKQVVLLCSVVVGGPTVDKNGAVKGSTERTLEPGTPFEFADAEADRLIALGAARLPVAEAAAEAPTTEPEQPPA